MKITKTQFDRNDQTRDLRNLEIQYWKGINRITISGLGRCNAGFVLTRNI